MWDVGCGMRMRMRMMMMMMPAAIVKQSQNLKKNLSTYMFLEISTYAHIWSIVFIFIRCLSDYRCVLASSAGSGHWPQHPNPQRRQSWDSHGPPWHHSCGPSLASERDIWRSETEEQLYNTYTYIYMYNINKYIYIYIIWWNKAVGFPQFQSSSQRWHSLWRKSWLANRGQNNLPHIFIYKYISYCISLLYILRYIPWVRS